jgi:hypothetical protein
VWLTAVLLAGALLAACGPGTVHVAPPAPAARSGAACERLRAALPATLDGHARRTTTPASPFTAACGDPPIVMRCGVGLPRAYQPTSQLFTIDGVDWLPEQLAKKYIFTTVGLQAGVELTVPHRYAPEVNAATDMSVVVGKAMRASASATPGDGATRR